MAPIGPVPDIVKGETHFDSPQDEMANPSGMKVFTVYDTDMSVVEGSMYFRTLRVV